MPGRVEPVSFQRVPLPFACRGLNLSKPVDKLAPNEYRALENTRAYGDAQILGRQGLTRLSGASVGAAIHSLWRLNDPVPPPAHLPGSFGPRIRFIGAGTNLFIATPTLPVLAEGGFSGNPLSFVTARPDFSSRPWVRIADSAKLRVSSTNAPSVPSYFWGIAPPNFAPSAAIGGAVANGPNSDPAVVPGSTKYVYRIRGRAAADIKTGAIGNAGPPMRLGAGIQTVGSQSIVVSIPQVHPDPQVSFLDIFRFGGTLVEWIYVGTVPNQVTTFTDTNSDAAIAAAPRLDFDRFQPFPSIDQPKTGTCTVVPLGGGGATVISTGGAQFLPFNTGDTPYWGFGSQIIVEGIPATMYRSPDDATHVEVLEDLAAGAGLQFVVPNAQIWHQQLPFIWGPFGAGATGVFNFGCGDPNRKGAIYWTNGNDPESVADTNVLDITSGSEAMQNGFMWDGRSYAFSTDRLFAIYPSFGEASQFVAVEVPNSKGLFARWALAVGPDGVYFRARDGVYKFNGGSTFSISDPDLYPVFPHESPTGTFTADGQNPATGGASGAFSPMDDTAEPNQRLAIADGLVFFDYKDQSAALRTLVFDTHPERQGWVSRDTYNLAGTPGVTMHYNEPGGYDPNDGTPQHNLVLGAANGNFYRPGGFSDDGVAIAGRVRTGARDAGDVRPRKLWADNLLDYDTACETFNIFAGFDDYEFFSLISPAGQNFTGRRRSVLDINDGLGQFAANIGLDISWSASLGQPALYYWEAAYEPKPELTLLRASGWSDCGYPGDKFFQGVRIHADTLGVTRTIEIRSDGNGIPLTVPINTSNEQRITFSFPAPFISKLVRVHPNDTNFWRLFDLDFIWEPAPDLATNWITQGTTLDFPGYWHHRDGYFSLLSSALVTLLVTADGAPFSYALPSTGGLHAKLYAVLKAMKAKEVSYSLTSPSGFRLFKRDCAIRVKGWGDSGPYIAKNPFGDVHRIDGASV
jgi:hypothetical protein